jgi:hypothetical protein
MARKRDATVTIADNEESITTKTVDSFGLKAIAANEGRQITFYYSRLIDFEHEFKVLELRDGRVYVETVHTDANTDITTVEVLMSRNRKTFCIIQRHRFGEGYDRMQSFDRDTKYPLFSWVRL